MNVFLFSSHVLNFLPSCIDIFRVHCKQYLAWSEFALLLDIVCAAPSHLSVADISHILISESSSFVYTDADGCSANDTADIYCARVCATARAFGSAFLLVSSVPLRTNLSGDDDESMDDDDDDDYDELIDRAEHDAENSLFFRPLHSSASSDGASTVSSHRPDYYHHRVIALRSNGIRECLLSTGGGKTAGPDHQPLLPPSRSPPKHNSHDQNSNNHHQHQQQQHQHGHESNSFENASMPIILIDDAPSIGCDFRANIERGHSVLARHCLDALTSTLPVSHRSHASCSESIDPSMRHTDQSMIGDTDSVAAAAEVHRAQRFNRELVDPFVKQPTSSSSSAPLRHVSDEAIITPPKIDFFIFIHFQHAQQTYVGRISAML